MIKKMMTVLGVFFLLSGVAYGDAAPITVEILSVDEPIDIGNRFRIHLQITNAAEADQQIRYQCCKGGHPWRFEYPFISVEGDTYDDACEFSPCEEEFTLKPGESHPVDLEIVMSEKARESEIGLEIGFDYEGEVYWSGPVTVQVNESLDGATFQDEP